MKRKHNLLLLFVSLIIVILIGFKIYYPIIQGKLKTDLNAVYLAYTDPDYSYDGNFVSFSASADSSKPGIQVKLGNGSQSGYNQPEFSVTYQIHSKFDRFTGKLVLPENQKIEGSIVDVKITVDKSNVLFQEEWDVTKQPSLELDIPLDKARTINLYLHTKEFYDGEVLNIGLQELAVSKDNAKPSVDEKPIQKQAASISPRSLFLLPKKVNDPTDAKYLKLYNLKHSMKYVDFANNPDIYATDFSGEMSFFLLDGDKNDPLIIKPEDIKLDGAAYQITQNFNKEFVISNISPNKENIKIYIPKGTKISRDGYQLKKDYVIKDVTIVSSTWEGVKRCFKPYLPMIIIFGVIIILVIIISILTHRKDRDSLSIDACVLNITISFLLSFVVFGLPSLLSNSLLRGGYGNDIGLMLLLGMYVLPCGTILVYRLLMTWRFNIKSTGIFLGTIAFSIEIILTVSGVYLIGMLFGGVIVGSIGGVKAIMKDN
jgi:hypothetical protein